jgi:hypothetical protein
VTEKRTVTSRKPAGLKNKSQSTVDEKNGTKESDALARRPINPLTILNPPASKILSSHLVDGKPGAMKSLSSLEHTLSRGFGLSGGHAYLNCL